MSKHCTEYIQVRSYVAYNPVQKCRCAALSKIYASSVQSDDCRDKRPEKALLHSFLPRHTLVLSVLLCAVRVGRSVCAWLLILLSTTISTVSGLEPMTDSALGDFAGVFRSDAAYGIPAHSGVEDGPGTRQTHRKFDLSRGFRIDLRPTGRWL